MPLKENNTVDNIVFMYAGMGSEWNGMGRCLYIKEPVFRKAIDEVDDELNKYTSWSLVTELLRDDLVNKITSTIFSQVANLAIQYGLTRMWENVGIIPQAVIGHSYGENMAFCRAGIYSLGDAVKISYIRGTHQCLYENTGKMLVIHCDNSMLKDILKNTNVCLAAINSQRTFVLSGASNVIHKLYNDYPKYTKLLSINVPYHSKILYEIDCKISDCLNGIAFNDPCVPVYSTVTGKQIVTERLTNDYLFKNSQRPVLFKKAVENLIKSGYRNFIEISAHPNLVKYTNEILYDNAQKGNVFYSMKKSSDESIVFRKNVHEVLLSGVCISGIKGIIK